MNELPKGIKVCGYRVLIKPDAPEKVTEGGIVLIEDERRVRANIDTGTLVAVGPTAWKQIDPGNPPWAKVGDKVMYVKFSQKIVSLDEDDDDARFVVINDDDILLVLEEK